MGMGDRILSGGELDEACVSSSKVLLRSEKAPLMVIEG